MDQQQSEKKLLDNLWALKSRVPYDLNYQSTARPIGEASLGTVESDSAGRYGRWAPEAFRASKLAEIATRGNLQSVLDVGGGNLLAASYFAGKGLQVDVSDYSTSPYLSPSALEQAGIRNFVDGDFNTTEFAETYDLVWVSHVLEHQLNVHDFLVKLVSLVNDGGSLALAVPPRKPFIISGHVNLFNPGLLLYRVILAGVDCSDAKVFQYDGNICLLVKVERFDLPQLNYDLGDIQQLSRFFPNSPSEGFNGDFMHLNLSQSEEIEVYG